LSPIEWVEAWVVLHGKSRKEYFIHMESKLRDSTFRSVSKNHLK
jgi:hypothetical protein